MAKKVVATLKSGKGKEFSKVIKMTKSPLTGAYTFKQEVVHNDHIKDFLKAFPVYSFITRCSKKLYAIARSLYAGRGKCKKIQRHSARS